MSLYIDIRTGDERIGDIKITRLHDEADPVNTVRSVNTYRWHYTSDGLHEATGLIGHRYGDGALALAHKVLGEITERHAIAKELRRRNG